MQTRGGGWVMRNGETRYGNLWCVDRSELVSRIPTTPHTKQDYI